MTSGGIPFVGAQEEETDGVPWGGSGMIALQEMLMQEDGRKVICAFTIKR